MRSFLCVLCLCPALCAAIEFPDSSLEAKVRQALGKESGALRPDDFDGLHHFEADRKGIASLSGIAHLHDVELLQLANNGIADLAPLANLQHLQKLDLRNNQISDLGPLADLPPLRELALQNKAVTALAPLSGSKTRNNGQELPEVRFLMMPNDHQRSRDAQTLRNR